MDTSLIKVVNEYGSNFIWPVTEMYSLPGWKMATIWLYAATPQKGLVQCVGQNLSTGNSQGIFSKCIQLALAPFLKIFSQSRYSSEGQIQWKPPQKSKFGDGGDQIGPFHPNFKLQWKTISKHIILFYFSLLSFKDTVMVKIVLGDTFLDANS